MPKRETVNDRCGVWESPCGDIHLVAEIKELEPLHYCVEVSEYHRGVKRFEHMHTIQESGEAYLTRNDNMREAGYHRVRCT